jgi:pyruvate dehydrogenase E2 component (dihydrolipoamide acetyltransferase)
MPDILMPKLSDSMEQGTILTWLKASGDRVEIGEEILEIETDKSTVAYAAEDAGALEILVQEGVTVAVGEPIARIGQRAPAPEPAPGSAPSELEPQSITAAHDLVQPPAVELIASFAVEPVASASNGHGHRGSATPLAKRTAEVHGVELDGIQGTGPLGRITRADVLRSAGIATGETTALPTISAARPPSTLTPGNASSRSMPPGSTRKQLSRLQQLIASRMAEAKATVPHFQVQTEVAMDSAISLRAQLKSLAAEGDPVPSLNDIIIKAAAIALKEHPLANGSFQDDGFLLHDQVNIGMAVAADEALVVPTVFDADRKTLVQIAAETRSLSSRVRDGQISPAELEGGTFTVSNLGMFGMTAITPVINTPQAAILGVGALRESLARVDAEIVDRTLLTLTLSCDHRILYGADASRFLARIRELLEAPIRLAF